MGSCQDCLEIENQHEERATEVSLQRVHLDAFTVDQSNSFRGSYNEFGDNTTKSQKFNVLRGNTLLDFDVEAVDEEDEKKNQSPDAINES